MKNDISSQHARVNFGNTLALKPEKENRKYTLSESLMTTDFTFLCSFLTKTLQQLMS